jgi:hypothetical protein
MTRGLASAVAIGGAALAVGAAQPPTALAQAQAGLWEISGVPGAAAPVRQCLADLALLARFEHRAKSCSANTVREAGTSSVIDYNCGAAGFGHSEVNVITPRSLRIATQGISDGLPFNYVLQAHRIADCPVAARH